MGRGRAAEDVTSAAAPPAPATQIGHRWGTARLCPRKRCRPQASRKRFHRERYAHVIDVLHIDDNLGDLDLFRSAFEDASPLVHYVGEIDPIAAMTHLGLRAADRLPLPRLIVVDINMPRARGQDVLAFLRLHPTLRHIPAVVLTTSTRAREVQECKDLGAREVFLKPNTYDTMVAVGRAILSHATP